MSGGAVLGIDLGGTNCRGALVTIAGELTHFRRIPTRIEEGLGPFLDRLEAFCRELIDAAGNQGMTIRAVGMGVPGAITDGIVASSPNMAPLNGVDLGAHLQGRLGLPVSVVNDANAIAWGEAIFGAGRPFPSFITLTLGTGVGGALVLERRLWTGPDGTAGEVGHIMVEPDGRSCGCGGRGCLEQYASASGIVRTAQEILAAAGRLPEREMTAQSLAEAARQGDRTAQAAMAEAGRRLGQVLAGVANLLNLEAAVITGGASGSLELMFPSLTQELAARTFEAPARRLQIIRGELGDDAGILGAAALAATRGQSSTHR